MRAQTNYSDTDAAGAGAAAGAAATTAATTAAASAAASAACIYNVLTGGASCPNIRAW